MSAVQPKRKAAKVADRRRKNYLAAVRYLDGRREIIEVRNADDLADARIMVLEELGPVRCLLLSGASQDSCRLIHAANRVLFSAWRSRMTASRSGLSVTGPTGDQSRVFPDQRAGLSSRAWRYV